MSEYIFGRPDVFTARELVLDAGAHCEECEKPIKDISVEWNPSWSKTKGYAVTAHCHGKKDYVTGLNWDDFSNKSWYFFSANCVN